MAAVERCSGCGADVARTASFCLKCGRSTAAPLRELERLDVTPEPVGDVQRAVADSGGGGRRRGVMVLGVVAVVVAAAVVLLADGSDDTSSSTEPSTTNEGTPSTQLLYPPSTRRGETTMSPSTAAAPTLPFSPTTNPAGPATTTVTMIGDGPHPVLGDLTGGLSLYVATGDALRRVELDTGRLTTLDARQYSRTWQGMEIYNGEVQIDVGGTIVSVPADLSAGFQASELRPGLRAGETDERWVAQFAGDNSAKAVLLRGPEVVGQFDVPGGAVLIGIVGDRVVMQGGGRIYTMDRTGRTRFYATGNVVNAGGNWLLWSSCDESLRCRYHLGDVSQPDAVEVNLGAEMLRGYYNAGGFYSMGASASIVAPDGATALLPGDGGATLVELSTGRVIEEHVMAFGGYCWSPDGAWFFATGRSQAIVAISTSDGHPISVLPAGRSSQNGNQLLAVG
jgi:hypothetical protein